MVKHENKEKNIQQKTKHNIKSAPEGLSDPPRDALLLR